MHAELTLGLGLPVNLKRIARLMRDAGIQGLYRRRRRGCTLRDPDAEPTSDLVNRDFTVAEPNRLWITDITEHPTLEGKIYCAAVMDAYSQLVIGWSIAEHVRTELVTDALGMATIRRRPQEQLNAAHIVGGDVAVRRCCRACNPLGAGASRPVRAQRRGGEVPPCGCVHR